MKKWTALVMALALVALLVTGCGEKTPEQDAATVVAQVGDEKITKGEAEKVYDFILKQTAVYYAQSGQSLDITSDAVISNVKAQTLQFMTETLALEQKLAELGGSLTEEERAELSDMAQAEYEMQAQYFVDTYGLTLEEAASELDAMGYTPFAFDYMIYSTELSERLRPLAGISVEVTDEQVQAEYDALVTEKQEAYAATPTQFIDDFLVGTTLYYQPEGFRLVKNLVVGFSEESQAKLDEKDAEAYNVYSEQYMAMVELYGNPDITDERKAELEALMAEQDTELERLDGEYNALVAEAQEADRPAAEAILEQVKAEGADFDALMAEYNTDTATGVALETGYPVAADISYYVQAFTDGAMALAAVGDISDLVPSEYGFHILKYMGDITPGPVPLETVREAVEASLLAEQEAEAYAAKENEWLDNAKIKTYINKF